MHTIESPTSISKQNPHLSEEKLEVWGRRQRALIFALPKDRRDQIEGFKITQNQRQALLALVEEQCCRDRLYREEAGINYVAADLAARSCLSAGTISRALRALAKAGWILLEEAKKGPSVCRLGTAIELYVELVRLKRLEKEQDPEQPDPDREEIIYHHRKDLVALLAQNKEKNASQRDRWRFLKGLLKTESAAKLLKLVEKENKGEGSAHDLVNLAWEFLGTLPRTAGALAATAVLATTNVPATGTAAEVPATVVVKTAVNSGPVPTHSAPVPNTPARKEPELVRRPDGSIDISRLVPNGPTDFRKKLEDEKLRRSALNELAILGHQVENGRLLPAIIEFERSSPSIEALQQKVQTLKIMLRNQKANLK